MSTLITTIAEVKIKMTIEGWELYRQDSIKLDDFDPATLTPNQEVAVDENLLNYKYSA